MGSRRQVCGALRTGAFSMSQNHQTDQSDVAIALEMVRLACTVLPILPCLFQRWCFLLEIYP